MKKKEKTKQHSCVFYELLLLLLLDAIESDQTKIKKKNSTNTRVMQSINEVDENEKTKTKK